MYNIETSLNENTKKLIFHGSINSQNAEEVGKLIAENLNENDCVVFDFDDVDYISSAGLRLVLKYGKFVKEFEVINVRPEVYEVFDMTGFTEILKISKALREISIEGKELIGEGYNGKVYRLDPETIIKVYYRNGTLEAIKKEIGLAKIAFVLGVPTAIPFDVVKVKEANFGSVFELLNSNCFNKLFIAHPEKTDEYIEMYVSLLKDLMKIRITKDVGLPQKKDEARSWISHIEAEKIFANDVISKMKILVENIPDDNHLIHGDFHVKNIMMQGNEPLLIDMDTLGVGNEIFEFTAFFLTYLGYTSTDKGNAKDFLGIEYEVVERIFYRTIDEVFSDKTEKEKEDIVNKCALLGYFWLVSKTLRDEKENTIRLQHSIDEVNRLINKVDSLAL